MSTAHFILILTAVLGALGLWLMLPRGSSRGCWIGAMLAAIALGLTVSQTPRLGAWMSDGVFFALAGVTIVSAVATVTSRNPLYGAIWFGQSVLAVAGLFFFIGAQFLAVATIVVYAGAILVTFLFVLMLAQPDGKAPYDRVSWGALISAATGTAMVGVLSMVLGRVFSTPELSVSPPTEEALAGGVLASEHVARLGMELFGRHLIAVEVAGMLLFVALVGAAAIVMHPKKDA
jgi:NADH-quinone oxidoreductase subunit J